MGAEYGENVQKEHGKQCKVEQSMYRSQNKVCAKWEN
jgi:hypothetical protein